ncbi:hypothetical protein Aperf_G00000128413 [Anoplocephala perfoliata]
MSYFPTVFQSHLDISKPLPSIQELSEQNMNGKNLHGEETDKGLQEMPNDPDGVNFSPPHPNTSTLTVSDENNPPGIQNHVSCSNCEIVRDDYPLLVPSSTVPTSKQTNQEEIEPSTSIRQLPSLSKVTQTQARRINKLSDIPSTSTALVLPSAGTNREIDILPFPDDTSNVIADVVKSSAANTSVVTSLSSKDCNGENANGRKAVQTALICSPTAKLNVTETGNSHPPPAKRRRTSTVRNTSRFICNLCKSACSSLSELDFHTKQTHGTYRCQYCQVTFTQHCNLVRHIIKHGGVMPFQCDICGAADYRKDDLVRHIKKHHQDCLTPKAHIKQLHSVRKLAKALMRGTPEVSLGEANQQTAKSDNLGPHPDNTSEAVNTSQIHKAPKIIKKIPGAAKRKARKPIKIEQASDVTVFTWKGTVDSTPSVSPLPTGLY